MIHSFAMPEIGLCSNCERFIYGDDFIEPRRGTVICKECILDGADRSQGTSWRLIEEARIARKACA